MASRKDSINMIHICPPVTGGGRTKWQGTVLYLCIIVCLTDDHVKHRFLNRANVRKRHKFDGRNSDNRWVSYCVTAVDTKALTPNYCGDIFLLDLKLAVFEPFTNLWNSSVFNPVAPLSECYFDFQTAFNYEIVKSLAPATPEKFGGIFVDAISPPLDNHKVGTEWSGRWWKRQWCWYQAFAERASSIVAFSNIYWQWS